MIYHIALGAFIALVICFALFWIGLLIWDLLDHHHTRPRK